MSILISAKSFFLRFYRSSVVRIFFVFAFVLLAVIYVTYNYWLLPWLNRSISENYLLQTGHQLQHDKLAVKVRACTLSLSHLKDSSNLWQANSIFVDIDCLNSFRNRGVVINEILIKQLKVNPIQLANGTWNFDDIKSHITAANKSETKKADPSSIPVVIKKITIVDSTVNSNALVLGDLPLAITPLNAVLTNINLSKKNVTNISLNANINQVTPLTLKGTIDLTSLHGELDINLSNIPFIWFNQLLKPYVALEILHGSIDTNSHVEIKNGVPQLISSRGALNELKIRPTTMEQDAVKWKRLEWQDATVNVHDKTIKIPVLKLHEFDGQLIITKDRTTNFQAMIIKTVPQAPTPVELAAKPVGQGAPESQAWKFNIDRLDVTNSALGFFDESLTPTFNVIVQQFNGDITNIANDAEHVTVINLDGNVDGYAPVKLNGKGNFFIEQPKLEALFSFKQMDMGAFSPYSAEYAGWRIKKGLLSVDLDYRYEQGKIVGKNHVVIDHLEFGEKVRSAHAVDLPLRLGLSLLTDENGIAILDADIAGDPKSPSFNIRETLWRALINTIKKVVMSPFKLISDLLKTKEDLGRIEFTPGESQLSEAAINKVTLLQQALNKRPNMRLTIHGVYDENADVLALKHEQVKSALQKTGLSPHDISTQNEVWAKAIDMFYKSQGLTNSAMGAIEKYEQLAAQQVVQPERLSRLAHERAQAVKQYFVLKLGVSSESLLLDSENTCDKTNICAASAVIFTLED